MERKGSLQTALVHLLQEGSFSLPLVLFTEYKRVGLTEQEVMLLIHIMIYQEKEHQAFPTPSELEKRMNCSTNQIIRMLERLTQSGFLKLEHEINELGLRSERYLITPLLQQLVASFVDREEEEAASKEEAYDSIFPLFEQEFGRPLSPMECESLSDWIDVDCYSEELIATALREAVFCGKVSFRYIDRILLEWQRNQIRTADEAIEYSRRFRQKGVLYQAPAPVHTSKRASNVFTFYNWVNKEGQ